MRLPRVLSLTFLVLLPRVMPAQDTPGASAPRVRTTSTNVRLDGKLDLNAIGELRWDRIEDRLMGLVPHEFKALVVRKPSGN